MPLAPLPPATVKLIGSSQVITSVSYVVKELMENSIDAGAQHIEIKLDKHGLEKIEVKDDGCGISQSDVTKMCLSSYTSKISDFSDLDSLSSYGFRGEALSALCNVANVSVTTKSAEDKLSTCYTFDHNGQVTCSKFSHLTKGTIVTVTELFKKLPVRKQFMSNSKRAAEELKRLEKLVKSLAVIHPRLRVTLVHNKFLCWQKTSVANLRQSVMQVVPLSMAKQLHHILHNTEQMRIEMMIPKCDCNVSSLCFSNFSDAHFLFINQRPVRNKEVEKVLYNKLFEYFGVYLPVKKYPLCVICISVPPDCLDVNLEPNKTRVYLKNQDDVLDIVRQCMHVYYGNNPKEPKEENVSKPTKKRKMELDVLDTEAKKQDCLPTNSEEFAINNDNLESSYSVLPDITKDGNWDGAFEQFCLDWEQSKKEASVNKTKSTDVVKETECSNIMEQLALNYLKDNVHSKNNGNQQNVNHTVTKEDMKHIDMSEDYLDSCVNLENPKEHLDKHSERGTLILPNLNDITNQQSLSSSEPGETVLDFGRDVDSEEDSVTLVMEQSPSMSTDSGKGTQDEPPTLSQWSRGEVSTTSGALVKGSRVLTNNMDGLSPQPSGRSVSSQMGCKEMSGFTRFAKNMRKQILEENPHMSFTRVAQQLQVKWRELNSNEKKKYEEDPPLKKAVSSSPAQKQKTLMDMKNLLAKESPNIELDVNMSSLKQMVKCTTRMEEEETCMIGQLEASPLWLYRGPDSSVTVFSLLRLQEAVKFHQHLSNFALPTKLLDMSIPFNSSDVGETNWRLLISLERSPNGVVKDQRILSNGFVVEIVEDETEACLTYVPQHLSHCGVQELQEVLILLCDHGSEATLALCRPLRVISLLRSEVMRECSSQEPPTEFSQVSMLLSYWLYHVAHQTRNCIHHLPVTMPLPTT